MSKEEIDLIYQSMVKVRRSSDKILVLTSFLASKRLTITQ